MSLTDFYADFFPFWGILSDADQKLLCENTTEEHFESEQTVHDNLGCSGLFIVRSGKLRIYMLSEDGKEITLYRLGAGDVCMLSASCVLQSISFDVYVDAEVPSDCYRITAAAFGTLTERVPEVKIYALERAIARFSDVMWVMQQIVFMRQDQRLAIFLLEEIRSNGTNAITMTHETIARHLGTAREVVSRTLKHLAADGMIEVTRKAIVVIDKKKLQGLAY